MLASFGGLYMLELLYCPWHEAHSHLKGFLTWPVSFCLSDCQLLPKPVSPAEATAGAVRSLQTQLCVPEANKASAVLKGSWNTGCHTG